MNSVLEFHVSVGFDSYIHNFFRKPILWLEAFAYVLNL